MLETRNVNYACIYVCAFWFDFPGVKDLLESLKSVVFWTPTISYKTCRRSWNLVVFWIWGNLWHFSWKSVSTSWNKINRFSILKHLYLNILQSFQLYQHIRGFICAEGLWIRIDLDYEVSWYEGHEKPVKSAWSICIQSLKHPSYTLSRGILLDKTNV